MGPGRSGYGNAMSYIHDALRKAQREKDAGYRHYEPALQPAKGHARRVTFGFQRVLYVLFTVLVFAFLSLLGYNFFTGTEEKGYFFKEVAVNPESVQPTVPSVVKEKSPEPATPLPALEELYQEAVTLQREGNTIGAERVYKKILARDHSYVFALNNLGVIRLNQGAREKARSFFEQAIRTDGGYVDPLYNMACLHAQSGNTAGALELLQKARRLDEKILKWAERDADLAALCESAEYKKMFYTNGEDKTQ